MSTRTVLGMAEDDLLESGDEDAARAIGIVLKATSVEAEDVALLDQLKALYPVLATPVVEPVVARAAAPRAWSASRARRAACARACSAARPIPRARPRARSATSSTA